MIVEPKCINFIIVHTNVYLWKAMFLIQYYFTLVISQKTKEKKPMF